MGLVASSEYQPDPDDVSSGSQPFGLAECFRPELDAYEGPLDVMLDLARRHRIELSEVPIGTLVDQFLIWLNQIIAKNRGLERGAATLIAVAWLVDLKVRSLIPGPKVTSIDPADALRRQLMHLELIRNLSLRLMDRNRLGRNIFERGFCNEPRIYRNYRRSTYRWTRYYHISPLLQDGQITWISKAGHGLLTPPPQAERQTLIETARRFGTQKPVRSEIATTDRLVVQKPEIISVERALQSFRRMAHHRPGGFDFTDAVPPSKPQLRRSAFASSLVATLEMVREGEIEICQSGVFAPIIVTPILA